MADTNRDRRACKQNRTETDRNAKSGPPSCCTDPAELRLQNPKENMQSANGTE